jgi:hypothetical protein
LLRCALHGTVHEGRHSSESHKLGTNFCIGSIDSGVWRNIYHIGKRRAAGLYCWDCSLTLCRDGEVGIHHGSGWHMRCQKCGQHVSFFGKTSSINTHEKSGISICSSFIWAMRPDDVFSRCCEIVDLSNPKADINVKCIGDEYCDLYTYIDFLRVLLECPIQYFDHIGLDFR